MDHDRNLMLFLNIDSSIVCLFFFEKSYRLFEKYQSSFGRGEQTGFLPTPVSPRKIVGEGNFVERIFLYRTLSYNSKQYKFFRQLLYT